MTYNQLLNSVNYAQKLFQKALKENPNKIFITCQAQKYSFNEVFQKASEIAAKLLEADLKPLDRIAISFWNEPEFVFAYFGVLLAGGIIIPISPLLTQTEINNILKHAGARALFNSSNSLLNTKFILEKGSTIADIPPDLAAVIYTSGTTGLPKGVMLSYKNIKAQIQAASEVLQLSHQDSFLGILSFAHVFGQMDILWAALNTHCTVHLLPRFEASEALKLLTEKNISILIAVPTMYQLMLRNLEKNPREFKSLRICHSGAAPMPEAVFEAIEKYFKAPMQEGYGLTETCSMAFSNPLQGPRKKTSVGLPIKGLEFELRDENNKAIIEENKIGEVYLKGDIVTLGYLSSNTKALNNNNWLPTGDLGFKDKDGYLFLVDRKKNLIIRGGLKIYPREIEEVLLRHSQIAEAAIIGIPSALQGQKPKAFLVSKNILTEAEQKQIINELKELCKQQLAQFKIPTVFEFIAELPKTNSGKILKRNLL